MVLQQDKGGAQQPFDTGLPRVQSSEDVPRWLIVFGAVAAGSLLFALLRYAIDLLGVVFLIILVGFSIRAISDWLTEGESVSGWAVAAVFGGLVGTVMVGLWLFGSRDIASGALEGGVPAPVIAVSDWLESHGWGQRVLVGSSGSTSPPPAEQGKAASGASPTAPTAPTARPSAAAPAETSNPSPETTPEPAPLRKAPARAGTSSGGEAEAATARPSPPPAQPRESGAGESPAPRPEPTTQPAADPATVPSTVAPDPVSVATSTSLSSSHSSSVVGTSVRFTAVVTAEGGGVPVGVVVFYDGDRTIGIATLRGSSASATAVLPMLNLAIGDHEIAAEFHGSHGFLGSRSPSITQTVSRH